MDQCNQVGPEEPPAERLHQRPNEADLFFRLFGLFFCVQLVPVVLKCFYSCFNVDFVRVAGQHVKGEGAVAVAFPDGGVEPGDEDGGEEGVLVFRREFLIISRHLKMGSQYQ